MKNRSRVPADIRNPTPSRGEESGFTLIELLIVVAIIGVISAIAIPAIQRALFKAELARLASNAKTLHTAFVRYNADNSFYPSTRSPKERAFDRESLDPLVANGYLKSGRGIVEHLKDSRVTAYDSPNIDDADTQYWAVLVPSGLGRNTVEMVVGDTDNFPGFEGTYIDGAFYIVGEELIPVDEDILAYLAEKRLKS